MNISCINTSSVTKHTKEEGGDFSGSDMSEAKGAYKCPLSTFSSCQDTVWEKKKKHFEHKLDLALGLENPRSFCVWLFVPSWTDFLAIPAWKLYWTMTESFWLACQKADHHILQTNPKRTWMLPFPDLAPRSHRPFYSSNVGKACHAVTSKDPQWGIFIKDWTKLQGETWGVLPWAQKLWCFCFM